MRLRRKTFFRISQSRTAAAVRYQLTDQVALITVSGSTCRCCYAFGLAGFPETKNGHQSGAQRLATAVLRGQSFRDAKPSRVADLVARETTRAAQAIAPDLLRVPGP